MIQIKNIIQTIYIYKSNYDYSTSGSNSLVLENDLTNEIYNLNFTVIDYNTNNTSFSIDFSTLNIVEGFYSLRFYNNDIEKYYERIQYSNKVVITDYGNSSIINESDGYSSIIIE